MTVLDAVVFRVNGAVFTRLDVLRWAERHDAGLASRVRRRRALSDLAAEDQPGESILDEVAANFRYDRGLEDAAAMEQWLAERGISVEDWWEALRRSVLEAGIAGAPPGLAPETEDDDVTAGEWLADLCASDLLDAAVLDVARRAAVSAERRGAEHVAAGGSAPDSTEGAVPWGEFGVGSARLAACDARLDTLESAWNAWRSEVVTDAALRTAVDHHRLEWLVLDLVQSWWPGADAAREAIWCVKDDGQALASVAAEAGAPAESSVRLLHETPASLHDLLLAAGAGDVVGPVEVGTHWVVASVVRKRQPSLAEQPVRAAAERAVERAAATPMLERHVAWPDPRP